jgi:hypothetical protein
MIAERLKDKKKNLKERPNEAKLCIDGSITKLTSY